MLRMVSSFLIYCAIVTFVRNTHRFLIDWTSENVFGARILEREPFYFCMFSSDVNKDWTCKDKDKDQAYKDQDKDKDLNLVLKDTDKDFTYSYLLQVAAKPTIAIKQQQWTQSENSQHMTVKPITLNK